MVRSIDDNVPIASVRWLAGLVFKITTASDFTHYSNVGPWGSGGGSPHWIATSNKLCPTPPPTPGRLFLVKNSPNQDLLTD